MGRILRSEGGFTYLAALILIIVLGITVSGGVSLWSMQMKRERETELLYRLTQYRNAMRRWYKVSNTALPGSYNAAVPLTRLEDLLKDPNNPNSVRYLRKLFKDPVNKDPITGQEKDFEPIKDANQRIVGVRSASEAEPLKQANFPDEFIGFEGKKKYSEWVFNCFDNPKPGSKGGVSGLPGSPNPNPSQSYDNTGVPGWGAPPPPQPSSGVPGWGTPPPPPAEQNPGAPPGEGGEQRNGPF